MSSGNDSAFPIVANLAMDPRVDSAGLTKRELFAAMAMQGLCANPSVIALTEDNCVVTMIEIEGMARGVADATLAELAKEQK